MAQALSEPAEDMLEAVLPEAGMVRSPPHLAFVDDTFTLRAVAVSYHTALVREPLSFWMRMLSHRFRVEAAVHVLEATAQTPEDIQKLHSHCQFIDGAWCASDERFRQLNEYFESVLLSCHKGDHKVKHHFISDAKAYHRRFLELFDQDEGMRSADLFMCGEPVIFCLLLSHFGA